MAKEDFSTGEVLKQSILAAFTVLGILAALIFVPMGLEKLEQAKAVARIHEEAAAYLMEKYPGNDFQWETHYEPQTEGYIVQVQSQSSTDTHFRLEHPGDDTGFCHDTYEYLVPSGLNTRQRVSDEYEAAVLEVLHGNFPVYEVEADFHGAQGASRQGKAEAAQDTVVWVTDQEYDASQVGAQIGYVILWLDGTKQTYTDDQMNWLARQAAALLDEAGIGVYAFDIMLADSYYYGSPMFHFEKRILKSEMN